MALSPASGGMDGDSSQDDDFDEDGQLPEVISRGATLLSQWQRAAALSKDRFALDSKLGQHDTTKYYKMDITIAHKSEDNRKVCDKAMVLMPLPSATGDEPVPFPGSAIYRDGLYTEVDK